MVLGYRFSLLRITKHELWQMIVWEDYDFGIPTIVGSLYMPGSAQLPHYQVQQQAQVYFDLWKIKKGVM